MNLDYFPRIYSLIISLLLCQSLLADSPIIVKHYQSQERYAFGEEILRLALSKVGNYKVIGPKKQYANEARGESELKEGRFDIQWMSTTIDREQTMIPIKVPIYRGLLGLRLVLVTKNKFEKLNKVKNIRDLRRFVAGHGKMWRDLPVYSDNALPVKTHVEYEKLFHMLIANRFDYMHRGINEIWSEKKRYSEHLHVVSNIMIFYPHPVYFFVNKEKAELAKQIERGLQMSLADGSYKKSFLKSFGDIIKKGNIDSKNLIILRNSVVPSGSDVIDTSWWLPAKFQRQIEERR